MKKIVKEQLQKIKATKININRVAINDPSDNFWGWVPESRVKVKEVI